MNWGEAQVGLEQVWRCRCWDCMAHRRHVMRKAALVALLLGLSCGWAIHTEAEHMEQGADVSATAEAGHTAWF